MATAKVETAAGRDVHDVEALEAEVFAVEFEQLKGRRHDAHSLKGAGSPPNPNNPFAKMAASATTGPRRRAGPIGVSRLGADPLSSGSRVTLPKGFR